MSQILLGQAYFLRFDGKLWAEMKPYPPLGCLHAAAVLRQAGHDVALFDAMLSESEADWDRRLAEEKPRFAVLFEDNFNYLSKMCLTAMREAAFVMIAMARRHGATVMVCGSDASDAPADYLKAGADFVIAGEGEATLAALIEALDTSSGAGPGDIDGLVFSRDGDLVRTDRRKPLRDLDALPFPARDLVDMDRYRDLWLKRHGYFSTNMATTRGCPYHCNWCAKPIWGQIYNSRSPENVAAELRQVRETLGADHIWFADDIFGLKPGWIARFADLLEADGGQIPFKCLSRADLLLRPGDAENLARAGCRTVWIGAESGSQAVLDAMEKGTTVAQIAEARKRLGDLGVRVGYFIQFGYPGEGEADIAETIRFVRATLPDELGVSVSYPLPGTRFHARVQRDLGEKRNWRDSDDLAMLYRGPFSTAFYRRLHILVHRELRHARHGHALAQSLPHPSLWRPRLARTLAARLYNGARLPWDRLRLALAKRTPHQGLNDLGPSLDRAAAGTPTAQD